MNDVTTNTVKGSQREPTKKYEDMNFGPPFEAVRIVAADYNHRSANPFDGSPFSSVPGWLEELIRFETLKPVTPNGTDYAEWVLHTDAGTILGTPGDWIIRDHLGYIRIVSVKEAVPHTHAEHLQHLTRKLQNLQHDVRHIGKLVWHEQRGEPEMGMKWCETCDGHGTIGERQTCGPCDGSGEVQAD